MASIERTAYPRFRKAVPARELHEVFTPSPAEVRWARETARTEANLLVLLVLLKGLQRLGYVPRLADVPVLVVVHLRSCLDLAEDVDLVAESERTVERYRQLVRERVGVVYDPEAARVLAERVIREAAQTKDNPADLINVALEELVKACEDLLDEAARRGHPVTLDVLAVNQQAHALYRRLGFHDVTRHGENNIKIRMSSPPNPRRSDVASMSGSASSRRRGCSLVDGGSSSASRGQGLGLVPADHAWFSVSHGAVEVEKGGWVVVPRRRTLAG